MEIIPTIAQCFWCGRARHEFELRGVQLRGQTPNLKVLDYSPCRPCQARMSLGLSCIEVAEPQEGGNPPIASYPTPVSPTGRWVLIPADQVHHLALPPASLERLKGRASALFEGKIFESLFGSLYQEGKNEQGSDGEVVRGEEWGSRSAEGDVGGLPEAPQPA